MLISCVYAILVVTYKRLIIGTGMGWRNVIKILFVWMQFFAPSIASAQYFGQNKPQYKQFEFQLYKTPHFELYHYFKSDSLVKALANQSEKWYKYHQGVFLDTFKLKNPLLIYSNHADFQQTSVISGKISVGTGGVTEGIKRRVVMPVNFSSHQTDHVLGHEMVHAFQYHIIQNKSAYGLSAIQNIPLWMIEGMAEYLSIGNTDSHTALWMRDALINDAFPTLKEMTVNYGYSPYRYGHAFWSYIAHEHGEHYIQHLMLETANKGVEQAISDVFMMSMDSLSVLWKDKLESHLMENINDSTFSVYGETVISPKNSGNYNLAPSVSPDGEKLVFLSERDLFSLDLYLADANTGDVINTLYSSTFSDEIDAISFLETAGTWSPDNRHFAYVAYVKGKSSLVIFDTESGDISDAITFDEVEGIGYPAWSPDGEKIVFTGLNSGISDLYLYYFSTQKIENITQDIRCNIQPSWNAQSTQVFYVTDESSPSQKAENRTQYNIASVKVKTGKKKVYTTFDGAQNLNPVVAQDDGKIYFLSDRDGMRNLYLLHEKSENLQQLTQYPTGITGMTKFSPALSISGRNLYYNMLSEGKFSIVKTDLAQIEKTAIQVNTRQANFYASRLMPYSKFPSGVDANLLVNKMNHKVEADSFYQEPIKSKFKLDYIGNTSVGVMAGRYGTGMAGSVEARFSDILSEHVLYTGLSINGEIYDFGGQVAYVNQKRPIKLGTSLSHIPYRTGYYSNHTNSSTGDDELVYMFQRTFVDKLSFFGYYPFNKAHRIEAGVSAAHYSYRTERIEDPNSFYSTNSQKKQVVDSPSPFAVGIIDVAYVIDNSKFGLASPIEGKRIRFGYERYLHGVNMNTFTLDYRKYFRVKPYTFAFRFYHFGRYGKGSDSSKLLDIFIGYPWYVRGYESGSFYGSEAEGKISSNQLLGSKVMVSNFEMRIPFSGPRKYGWFKSSFLFSELALFYDAGLAWDNTSNPVWSFSTQQVNKRIPVMSTGAALRINLLGAIIIEPYCAFPIHQSKMHSGNFGINILSGW
ncbi:PD40 domain-containing protein [Labilibacter marinus]|uniref:PD40 domain-containing protein n=1 Tax=Labilibacter marinus TaxID=1477105 RepID=UPI0009F8EE9B|nr:PD40 domain-containing protein [Labilibacter marinus]